MDCDKDNSYAYTCAACGVTDIGHLELFRNYGSIDVPDISGNRRHPE
jgi:hypothetical protein